jgi:predicted anti-sigma-YlaC factor YlaD
MGLCRKFRTAIITDYIDAELDKEIKGRVDAHLNECAGCRSFAEKVKSKLLLPFEELKPVPLPATLWPAIKEKICERREYSEDRKKSLLARLKGYSFPPRLSPALVGFVLLILISSLVFYNQQMKLAKEKERADYLSSLLGSTGAFLGTATSNFGTLIEEFFL